ncbi:MAG: tetratricopeptide repeat protein, partial [Candidatus Latescibacterota bacterium]
LHTDPDFAAITDPALRAVIESCLAKDPAERLEHGDALVEVLTEIVSSRTQDAHLASRSGSSRTAIYWGGFGLAIVVAALAYAFWPQKTKPRTGVEPVPTLAVLPFEVSGGENLQYLREGMVHLLAAKLDGLGDLASADVNATLSYVDRHDGRIDAEIGRQVSEQLGATGFVMGSIVEGGGSIQLTASIYGSDGSKQTTQEWSIGSDSLLLGAIDSLAIGLLSRRLSLQGRDIASVAVTTTRSAEALKSYLEGEKALREFGGDAGQAQAIQAFLKAVEIDSTFALAWDGIASYAGTGFEYQSLVYPARRAALRHSAGLPDRITVIMRAQLLFSEDRWQTAERLVRDYLRLHPTNPEAWYLLGEIVHHHWPRVGRSNAEAEQYFKRAFALDPSSTRYFQHLAHNPIRYRRFDELLGIVESPVWTPFLEQQHAILTGALEDGNSILPDSLRSIWSVILPVMARQPETAQLALARMTGPWRQNAEQYLRLATGQFSDAVDSSPLTPEHIVALWIPRFLLLQTYPEAELSLMKSQLQDWDDAAAPISEHWSPIVEVFSGDAEVRYPYSNSDLKIFANAMISWAFGDTPGVDAGILALSPQTGYDSTWTASAANILRALNSLGAGDLASAEGWIDQTAVRRWYQPPGGTGAPIVGVFPYYSEHMSRFLRAEILLAEHRYEAAKAWYTTFLDDADLFTWPAYFAPSIYKIGVCNEALGRHEEAQDDYRVFVGFWSEADPGLQPMVDEAQAGIERLERMATSEQ